MKAPVGTCFSQYIVAKALSEPGPQPAGSRGLE